MIGVQLLFVVYWLGFLALAWMKRKRIHAYEDYVVAGRTQPTNGVAFSILATAIGASALLGVSAQAEKIGWPVLWWIGVGAIGLLFQALFLTSRVRQIEATTLPDLVGKLVGKPAAVLVALVIALSWVGIVAAQFKAMGSVLSLFWPSVDVRLLTILSALAMVLYTLVGGQFSVIATDRWQFVLIVLAVIVPWLGGIWDPRAYARPFELLNDSFGWKDLLIYLVLTGGAYFVGPDMFSRVFCARDEKVARRAVVWAALGLVPLAILITWLGIMAGEMAPGQGAGFLRLAGVKFGIVGQVLMAFGILSTLISSADTTLLSSATIFVQDVVGKRTVVGIQILIGVIGVVAVSLALTQTPLLQMLLNVYSFYAPAVVAPTCVGLLASGGKKQAHKGLLLVAIVVGLVFGVVSLVGVGEFIKPDKMSAVSGVFVSLLIALVAWLVGKK